MNSANLINRGEQFEVIVDGLRFVGECVWSWEEQPAAMSRRVYPIQIFANSIELTGVGARIPLSEPQQAHIAAIAKQLLEARNDGCLVEVLDR